MLCDYDGKKSTISIFYGEAYTKCYWWCREIGNNKCNPGFTFVFFIVSLRDEEAYNLKGTYLLHIIPDGILFMEQTFDSKCV